MVTRGAVPRQILVSTRETPTDWIIAALSLLLRCAASYRCVFGSFFSSSCTPILRALVTFVVTTLRPRAINISDCALVLSAEQSGVVSQVQQTLAMCAQMKDVAPVLPHVEFGPFLGRPLEDVQFTPQRIWAFFRALPAHLL